MQQVVVLVKTVESTQHHTIAISIFTMIYCAGNWDIIILIPSFVTVYNKSQIFVKCLSNIIKTK